MEYKRYPKYRDSNVEWLSEIPKHWDESIISALFEDNKHKNKDSIEQNLLSLSYGRIINKDINTEEGLLPASFETYQIVEPDYIVLRLTDLQNDQRSLRVGHVRDRGIITSAYTALKKKSFRMASARYFYYLLHAYDLMKVFYGMGAGVRQSLSYDELKKIRLILPAEDEQKSIVRFLDRETTRIDGLIEKKQRLIELLKEKRQAVITQAVTKGLDPNVPMKDSGVEWLGEVPEHWPTKQIRHLVTFIGGGTPSKENEDYWQGDIPWVSPKDMKTDFISSALDNITLQAVAESSTTLIAQGAVLIVVRGMILLHSVPVALTEVDVTINQDMKALVPNKAISAKYLLYLLKGFRDVILSLMDSSAHGTRVLPTEEFKRMVVTVPRLDEQSKISTFIESQLSNFDRLLERTTKSIELLQEHRSALITAAVTGQIDIRNVA